MRKNRNMNIVHARGQSKGEVEGLVWEIGEPSKRQLLWWEIRLMGKRVKTGTASSRRQAFARMNAWLNE